ncbi:MAG: hypothetical protein EKK47_07095 [Burkholderiales bacterium]|jgi:hypothetical protein|nr:MAG: hypothetical protein EKK47_07095 [Burkholderiales bacterium]
MMNSKMKFRPLLTAVSLAVAMGAAQADERESLETLKQTTLNLIDALVQSGALTREKADALIAEAHRNATQTSTAQTAGAPEKKDATPDGRPVQRVPYISEAARAQIRNEIKEEVVSQARLEKWGVPNAPSWTDRIRIDGDFRFRYQAERADKGNTDAQTYVNAEVSNNGRITRAPDFSTSVLNSSSVPIAANSTTDDRGRERIRMRLGVTAKVSDEVGVGVRLATGNATERVSTNQTLGQNFNKYQLFVDRAFVKADPTEWLSIRAGRIPNPWFSTDMIWSENLNFEGVSSTASWMSEDRTWGPFATVGWFPIKESTVGLRGRKTLAGLQVGSLFQASDRSKFKLGLAYYRYHNIEGASDPGLADDGAGNIVAVNPNLVGMYEYPSGLRQKGNTVFETAPYDSTGRTLPYWGLAYEFAPLALTASAEFTHFSPYSLMVSAEYVYNTAFDVGSFRQRAGSAFASVDPGGKRDGYQLRLTFGAADVSEYGDWQVSTTYRHLGSDAVLDAFNDSDMGLGGTNLKGYILGFNFGLSHNTALAARYLSSKTIDPTLNSLATSSFGVNVLQVDLNVRF